MKKKRKSKLPKKKRMQRNMILSLIGAVIGVLLIMESFGALALFLVGIIGGTVIGKNYIQEIFEK